MKQTTCSVPLPSVVNVSNHATAQHIRVQSRERSRMTMKLRLLASVLVSGAIGAAIAAARRRLRPTFKPARAEAVRRSARNPATPRSTRPRLRFRRLGSMGRSRHRCRSFTTSVTAPTRHFVASVWAMDVETALRVHSPYSGDAIGFQLTARTRLLRSRQRSSLYRFRAQNCT